MHFVMGERMTDQTRIRTQTFCIGLVTHSSPSNDLCPRLSLHAFFSGRGKPVPGVGNRPGRESTKCNGMRDIKTDQTGVLTQDP